MTTKFSARTPKSFNKWRKSFQYIVCNFVIINVIKSKYNLLKTEGLENIDKTKKYVVASNHITGFDPFSVAACLNLTIAYMAKVELKSAESTYTSDFFKYLLASLNMPLFL